MYAGLFGAYSRRERTALSRELKNALTSAVVRPVDSVWTGGVMMGVGAGAGAPSVGSSARLPKSITPMRCGSRAADPSGVDSGIIISRGVMHRGHLFDILVAPAAQANYYRSQIAPLSTGLQNMCDCVRTFQRRNDSFEA